jgi:uncharacterized protein (DUF1697 family)
MYTYVAFLRGINVNGRRVLKADLKTCFEGMGFDEVETFLQGGSVRFESEITDTQLLKQQIEQTAEKQFSMPMIAFVFPLAEIKALVEAYPFIRTNDRHAYIILTDGRVTDLLNDWAGSDVDMVKPSTLGFYWSVPIGMTLDSPFAKYISPKRIAEHTTARNINTLEKMVA